MLSIKNSLIIVLCFFITKMFSQTTITYSVAGSTTWTVPSCVTSVTVQTFGGGGGGGGAIAIVRNSGDGEACSGAGGGGGGGYSSSVLVVVPGQVYTIVVGSGGIAGISGAGTWNGGPTTPAGAGGTGGTSSFNGNTYNVQATGGVGGSGSSAWNNSNPPDVNATGAGGTGGVGSGGATNFTGGLGRAGYILFTSTDKSGAGGGCAGPAGNGGDGILGSAVGISNPPGGIGQVPGGNGGDGRMNNIPANFNPAPFNGNTFGGGAGGALVHKEGYNVLSRAGGVGAVGAIIVRYSTPVSPGITSVSAPTITCATPTVQSAISYTNGATTFTWTGPAIVSGSNTGTVSVNGSGIYSYTASVGGCNSTGTVQIQSNVAYPNVTASTSNTLNCTTTTIQAVASATSTPVTYNWSGPGIVSGASTATAVVNAGGTYNYTVTNTSSGCITTGTLAVTQNTSVVTASTAATNSINCTSTTAQIVATTTASPVSYIWSGTSITGGAGTATINVNQGGTFNYTITNTSNGCRTTGSQAVTQNTTLPSPTATSPNSITCLTSTVALNGGPAALSYTWSGSGFSGGTNSQNAVASTSGSYTLTVTGTNGCTNTAVTIVGTNTTLPSPTATSANSITCITTTVALNGGPAALTYIWSGAGFSGGTNSQNAVATVAGSYTLAVTGTNGCTNTAVTTVGTNTTQPVATASLATAITCTSTSATLQGGPLSGVTYSWSGAGLTGATNQATATITAAGTYTLMTTSTVNGCTNTAVVTPTANLTPPQVSVNPDVTINCVTPTVSIGGSSSTSGVSYAWTGPSVGNPSGTSPTNSTTIVNSGGNYTLTVTNPANGCTNTAVQAVTSNVTLPSITVGSSQTITCSSASAVLTGSSSASPVNYSWTGPGAGNPAGSTPTNSNTTINAGGTYTLVVTDPINSCTNSAVVSITQNTTPPVITATNATTLTCTTLAANIVGTGGGTYAWSGTGITGGAAAATATVNQAGTYTLLVTAANGCTATANTTIIQNTTAPSANASNTSTLTCTTTTANLIGTGGGTYAWSGTGITGGATTATVTVNQAGTYTLLVTAANGCTATANTSVTQNTTVPTVNSNVSNTLTCSSSTINVSATTSTTPVGYNWTGPGITSATNISTITANQSGTYNYTVTNTATGCKTTGNISVSQNTTTPAVSTATSGVLNCTLTSVNASATTTASPVSYNWTGAGITSATTISTITVNQGGTYNYTVTNTSNGCTTTGSQSITQNTTTPSATASGGTLTCVNTSTTLVGGPASGVNYSWTGAGLSGATTLANATATATGSYTLVTTGATNGCTNTAVATVTNNLAQPTANAGSTQTLVCGVSSVTLTGLATPTTSSVNWLGGVCGSANSLTTTACAPGTYTLVVTHPTSGCINTSTVAVSSSTDVPQATVNTITNSITCTNSIVAIGVTLSNTDPVSYSWTGPGISGTNNTSTTSATVAGTYSVTITNTISNCQSVFNLVVPTNTTTPTTSANTSNTITCSTTSITVSATPTGTNYGYAWSGPGTIINSTTANPGVSAGGIYTVTVTDNLNGCIGTGTVNVVTNTVSPTITLTPSSLTTTCANPTATLLVTSSADPDVNYVWTAPSTGSLNNTTINNPVANGSGVFTVQVTNTVTGCVSSIETVTITADANVPALNATAASTAICSGATNTLSITGADTYTWSTTETATTITVSPTTTTTYSVTGTNTTTGCSNITNVIVNVTATPTVNIAATATTICEGENSTLTLTGATNYTVTNPSQTTTNTLTVAPTSQTTYTVIGESNNCNSNSTTITIDVNALPSIAVSNATTCEGIPVTLTATGVDTYTWSTTDNTSTTIVSPINNTTYTVAGTNTLTGCTSSITTADVTVNQNPTVTASANPNTICTSGTVNLNATTTATSYTWTLGNGVDNTNQNQGTISFPASGLTTGTYTYTVNATSSEGCISSAATATLDIIDVPNANFDLSDLSICQNENGSISINTAQTGVTYDWSINGQTITNANPLTVPTSITNATGTYTVNVIAGIGTCTNTAANTFTVNALPTIALVNPTASACENTSAQLDVANPTATYNYNWTNGSNTSTGPNLNVNPLTQSTAGNYTATVVDQNGCTNRTIGAIDAQVCETYVPEIFTPNGDGKNDGFVIKNIENYPNNKLKIFNRWGNMIYQKDAYQNEFEGYANTGDQVGKSKLPAGTYYVILDYGDGKTEIYNGFLMLQY